MIANLIMACTAVFGAPSGEIAFVSAPYSSPARVQVMSLETKSIRTVGPDQALGLPAWSPDGQRLAFAAIVDGGSSIYVVNADGTDGRYLVHAQPRNTGPVWSPDGLQLAYTAGEGLDAQVMV